MADALAALRDGDLEVLGRMPYSSNATFLVQVCHDGVASHAVYKPERGERPLWDFPSGLYQREWAAYLLAEMLGWDCIPPTVVRDGPLGLGSVQQFIDADFEQHYFTLLEDEGHHDQLRRMCVYDLLANSTDRKGGHVLVDADGHLWGIDNGLSFHAEFKLRTVIWDFAGERIPKPLLGDVERFLDTPLTDDLVDVLDTFECDGLRTRARAVLSEGRFPRDPSGRRWPWPVV
jgi:uncharacterized repeat protein (TIGR03843 family)